MPISTVIPLPPPVRVIRRLRPAMVWPALCALLFAASLPARAQSGPPPARPRLVLALGGGNARGFAHIGVLRWLAQNQIPVDGIAGTSAGGLIGGMYALGLTPGEIRDCVAGIEWTDIMRGAPAYRDLRLRRKEDSRDYPLKVEFGLKGGFNLPSGLNPAHELGLYLCRYALPSSRLDRFDLLPTPFRCVAADMLTAEPVVLQDGSLAQALRATMAIPGVFTLVERDGRTLADGALVNNLPVDVAQQMGADVVLAVDVSVPVYDPAALKSLTGTVAQALTVMQERNVRENRDRAARPPNLLLDLRDALREFSGTNYTRYAEIEARGYQALEQSGDLAAQLRRYRLNDADWAAYLAERAERRRRLMGDRDWQACMGLTASRRPALGMTPAFIECRVEGGGPGEARRIEGKLAEHCGRPLNLARFEADLTAVTGWGPYDSLAYETVRHGEQEGLRVRVTRKLHGPPFLRPGLRIDGNEWDNMRFVLGGRLIALDSRGDEWRTDVGLGSRAFLDTEYYYRLGGTGWFLAPRLRYDRSSHDLFQDRVRLSEYHTQQAGAELGIGYDFGRQTEIRAGAEAVHIVQSLHSGDPTLDTPDGAATGLFLRYRFDGSDDAVIPARGARVTGEGRWLFSSPGAGGPFGQAQLDAAAFKPLSKTASLFFLAAGGSTFGRAAPLAQQFTLGGPFHMTGFFRDELRGSHFMRFGGGYLHELAALPGALGQKLYVGGWYEYGSAFESLRAARYHHSLSAGLVADTLLGPVAFGGSWSDPGRIKVFLSVGRLF